MDVQKQPVNLFFAEEACADQKGVVRGFGTLPQFRRVYYFSKNRIGHTKKRTNYPGTTAGNTLGPIGSVQDPMQRSFKVKKDLFGHARMFVGGRDDDSGPKGCTDDKRKCERQDDDLEVVFYHALPYALCEDIAHACAQRKPKGIIELTAGDGALILYAIVEEIPVVAFALTDLHVEELRVELKRKLFKLMLVEGSGVHEPKLAELVLSLGTNTDGANGSGGAPPKPKKLVATPKAGAPVQPKKRKTPTPADVSKKAALKKLRESVGNGEDEPEPQDSEDDDDEDDDDDDADGEGQ
jgi:hypothetical protein